MGGNQHLESQYENNILVYHNNFRDKRKIFRLEDRYRKVWYGENPQERLGTKNLLSITCLVK